MKKIIAYKSYFNDFLEVLSAQERKKFLRALDLLMTEEKIPHHYIKYIRDGIYEFRTNYGNNEFRYFSSTTETRLWSCSTGFGRRRRKHPKTRLEKQSG